MAINSIVDYLKSVGQDSSYANRKKLAEANGISGYSGTASQNTNLLKLLQNKANTQTAPSEVTAPVSLIPSGVSDNVQAGTAAASPNANGFAKSEETSAYKKQLQTMELNKPAAYKTSGVVDDYYDRLQEAEANRPDAFQSQYEAEIDSILDSILNQKDFSYTADDLANDSLYQMYRDNYLRNGDLAMRDTMGNAAALTGGYGSTYATAAGQQAYDNYLAGLNDMALEFADRAYTKHRDGIADNYNQLSAVQGLDDIDYGRYRDQVGDYYNDLSYLSGRYDQEYAKDYGQYRDQVGDYNTDRNYLAAMYDTEYGHDLAEYQNAIQQQQWADEFAFQREQFEYDKALAEAKLAASLAKSGGGEAKANPNGSENTSDIEEIEEKDKSENYDEIVDKLTAWMNNGEMDDYQLYNQLMSYEAHGLISMDEGTDIMHKVGIDLDPTTREGYAPLVAKLSQGLSNGTMSNAAAFEAVMNEIDNGNLTVDEAEMVIREAGIDKAEIARENMLKNNMLSMSLNLRK